ncbi:MAG TPA: membrane protein insertase YidC [Gemmatimonadales bacterium]|nr:membrane protein insertase YidC [Gemmatimonadales bacterium]
MDQRRVILAVLLMFVVAIVPSLLFRPKQPVGRSGGRADSSAAGRPVAESASAPVESAAPRPPVRPTARESGLPAETVWVSSPLYRYGFSTRGARLIAAEIEPYKSFAPADSGRQVQLVPTVAPLLGLRIVVGNDTASLADASFTPDQKSLAVGGAATTLTFTAVVGAGSVTVAYQFVPTDYHFSVSGHVDGLGGSGGVLIVGLGQGLRSVEAEPLSDYREYAVVTKADKTQKQAFASIDPGKRVVMDGPFEWVGVKSKYFFAAILAPDQNTRPFAGAVATGEAREQVTYGSTFGSRTTLLATRASVVTTLALPPTGAFRYDVYLGPFEHRRLDQLGHGLDDANPYGWSIFRPIIHPVSILVVRILFWMHGALRLPYGWVLIAFGVLIRLLLWPLQRRAMESQMRMQAAQGPLQEIQARYKNDPQRLQQETLRLYKEHGVNPFGGCLPMLLPMPVLLALFFVFSNTIEFRGVPFLWLPDLSRADPLYIIPVIMGVSMFAVSKIGQRGLPPNPQTKTFLYVMPAMMTFIFLRLASGLNLYYAVQNLISLPQQWQISKRRLAAQNRPSGGS